MTSVVEPSEELQGRGCVWNGNSEPQRVVSRQKLDHLVDVAGDEASSFQDQGGLFNLCLEKIHQASRRVLVKYLPRSTRPFR